MSAASLEALMSQVLAPKAKDPIQHCLLAVRGGPQGHDFMHAVGQDGADGEGVTPQHRFRIGSLSKLFTATVVLQLWEEGALNLDAVLFDYLDGPARQRLAGLHRWQGQDYAAQISLRHLLQHRSGLKDYAAEHRFFQYVMAHPEKQWVWQEIIERYVDWGLHEQTWNAPGGDFRYADTNYLLLAVLIEQVTGQSLAQVLRRRILAPLGMADTYLEFYELPPSEQPMVYPHYGAQPLAEVNTSFDWGAGGLVSTLDDLSVYLPALYQGKLLKHPAKALPELGQGLQQRSTPKHTFVGHRSAYGSMLFYEPTQDLGIVFTLNQAKAVIKSEWLWKKMIAILEGWAQWTYHGWNVG